MWVNNQPNGVTERLLNMPERALPTFSESLKGVAVKNFPGGYAPRPAKSFFANGPPQNPMLNPPLKALQMILIKLLIRRLTLTSLKIDNHQRVYWEIVT